MWRWDLPDKEEPGERPPVDATLLTPVAVVAAAMRAGARGLPIGVIGPREATPAQMEAARDLGQALGTLGLPVLCGGRSGVMAAVAAGARGAGGLTIGVLPDSDWRSANPDIVVPLATGLSEARNAVIARAAVVLVAVGGSYGTLTEAAYGLHFGKMVIGLLDPPRVDGMIQVDSVAEAMGRVAVALLDLPDMS